MLGRPGLASLNQSAATNKPGHVAYPVSVVRSKKYAELAVGLLHPGSQGVRQIFGYYTSRLLVAFAFDLFPGPLPGGDGAWEADGVHAQEDRLLDLLRGRVVL